jgi:undecaprenyl-diphosphatase
MVGLTALQGLILGIIQGLTEFLPISSSGHLVLFEKLLDIQKGGITFEIAVHLATLISVCIVLRQEIISMIKKPFSRLTILVVVGTIPTLVIGAVFNDVFEKIFESGASLGFEFILTGLVLWYAESIRKGNKGLEAMTCGDAAVVGIAQGIAILPAVSRSGLTIAGALSRGLNREFALKFSFLMSIPSILAAVAKDGYDVLKAGGELGHGVELVPLIAGMIAAAISGYIAVRFMLKIFSRMSLKAFSYYVFALGSLIIVDQIFFGIFFEKLF